MPASTRLTKLLPKGNGPARGQRPRAVFQVVVVESGRLAFIAASWRAMPPATSSARATWRAIRQVCANLRVAIEAVGATPADLVKTSTFVTDLRRVLRRGRRATDLFGVEPPTSTTPSRSAVCLIPTSWSRSRRSWRCRRA